MPLSADLSIDDAPRSAGRTFGVRTATLLGSILLVAMALLTLLRWVGAPSSALEEVVQLPVPADASNDSARPDLTAPDPGDNLP